MSPFHSSGSGFELSPARAGRAANCARNAAAFADSMAAGTSVRARSTNNRFERFPTGSRVVGISGTLGRLDHVYSKLLPCRFALTAIQLACHVFHVDEF